MLFAVSGRGTKHIALENLRVITGAGETDPGCDFRNGKFVVLQKSKALLNAVAQKKIKRRLVQRLFEQAAKFTFAGMAGISDLTERDVRGIVAIYEGKGVFEPLDLPFLGRRHDDIRIEYKLSVVNLVDQIPQGAKSAANKEWIAVFLFYV